MGIALLCITCIGLNCRIMDESTSWLVFACLDKKCALGYELEELIYMAAVYLRVCTCGLLERDAMCLHSF
jgi:hypothetical protein